MKLAIVGPYFFGYLSDLAARMSAQNITATFYDERASNKLSHKIFVRFAPYNIKELISKRHVDILIDRIIAAESTHVLLVSTENISPNAANRLKAAGIKVFLYMFDALANKDAARALLPEVTGVASFDPQDCLDYGFLPIPLFSAAPKEVPPPEKIYDFLCCATLHSDRPTRLMELIHAINAREWRAKLMLFYHSRFLWMIRYANSPRVWPLVSLISTQAFSQTNIAQEIQRARVAIDLHHGAQSGLTMRTFEALALGSILLTTNETVRLELPQRLQERVVILQQDDILGSLQRAYDKSHSLPPLNEWESYTLSVDRFIAQIRAFITETDVPATFRKPSMTHSEGTTI